MALLSLTLKNYRPFALDAPMVLDLSEGITFLLGVNNVGKSALLRSFFELRSVMNPGHLESGIGRDAQYNVDLPKPFRHLVHRETPDQPIFVEVVSGGDGWRIEIRPQGGNSENSLCSVKMQPIGQATSQVVELVDAYFGRSMYVGPFRTSAAQVSAALYDVNVGNQFVQTWDAWANSERIDSSEQVRLLVSELRQLFGFSEFAVSVSQQKDQLYITTEDGRFSLSELGDGIAHYIIVLGNAMTRRPGMIFIDEPETGLHPRMQETFVRALATKSKFGLAATSHSIALARSVADVVLTVTRDSRGRRRCVPYGEHRSETLIQSVSELSYSQYAELGGNHLLLVEGRTDIKSFREILRKFDLDQHFIIWSLNGSDWLKSPREKIIDELAELKRLHPISTSVVFDSERTSEQAILDPALRQFHETCIDLGFEVFPTDRHSTENYITQAALDHVLSGFTALEPFEAFGAAKRKWDKNKNWLLFRCMTKQDFDGTGLGRFVSETLRRLVVDAAARSREAGGFCDARTDAKAIS